jgi:peptide deformylase
MPDTSETRNKLEIVRGFQNVLLEPTKKFDFEKQPFDSIEFAKLLGQVMLDNGGVGISACQVNVPYSVFAIRTVPLIVCYNPRIVDFSGNITSLDEGCLSFPGISVPVKRHDRIRLRYQEPNGEMQLKTFEGYTAHVIQHEVDHLNGVLFFRKTGLYHREKAMRRGNKMKRIEKRNAA